MYIDDNYVGEMDDSWLDGLNIKNAIVEPRNIKTEYLLHKAQNGKIYCINGTHPHYDCMTDDHLINTIEWIEKKAERGVLIGGNTIFPTDLDILDPPSSIYGDEVLKMMKYDIYIKEAKKRKLKWK